MWHRRRSRTLAASTCRRGGDLEPPTRALLRVRVVRLGVDAVIPVRRGRRRGRLLHGHLGLGLDHQRWSVAVGGVRPREPEGIPEERRDPEAEGRPSESETAKEAEAVEAIEALVAAVELAPVKPAATEPAVLEPGPAAVEPAPTAAMEPGPAAAVEPAHAPAVDPAPTVESPPAPAGEGGRRCQSQDGQC